MAEQATREFTDDRGEHVGQLMVEIIEHDGEVATVKWRIVDRYGNTLDEQAAMLVPHPTHGEASADDLLAPAIREIVKGRIGAGGSDTAAGKGKSGRKPLVYEEAVNEDWEVIFAIMRKLSRSRSRSKYDDDDAPSLARILSLFR